MNLKATHLFFLVFLVSALILCGVVSAGVNVSYDINTAGSSSQGYPGFWLGFQNVSGIFDLTDIYVVNDGASTDGVMRGSSYFNNSIVSTFSSTGTNGEGAGPTGTVTGVYVGSYNAVHIHFDTAVNPSDVGTTGNHAYQLTLSDRIWYQYSTNTNNPAYQFVTAFSGSYPTWTAGYNDGLPFAWLMVSGNTIYTGDIEGYYGAHRGATTTCYMTETPSGGLNFFVRDATTQAVVSGAYVLVDGSGGGLPIYQGFTDAGGYYNISPVLGSYSYTIGAMNYITQTSPITVSYYPQTVNIYLVPGNYWPPTTAPPSGYQEVDFYVHNENTGLTVPALVSIYKNGVVDATAYVQTYSGYAGFYLDQSTQYRVKISANGYFDYFITNLTTWANTTPMEIYTGIYPEFAYNTTTPTPGPTPSFNVTPIGTLSSRQRADKVGAGTDVWYLNVDFLSSLFFIAVVMGVLGLIGNSMGGSRGRRRR